MHPGGGDDYELLFTACASTAPPWPPLLQSQTAVTCIGQVQAEPGLRLVDAQGQPVEHRFASFDHFCLNHRCGLHPPPDALQPSRAGLLVGNDAEQFFARGRSFMYLAYSGDMRRTKGERPDPHKPNPAWP